MTFPKKYSNFFTFFHPLIANKFDNISGRVKHVKEKAKIYKDKEFK